jgi:hypothetical protein
LAKQKKVGAPPGAHPGSCISTLSKPKPHKEKAPKSPVQQANPAIFSIANYH